MTGLHFLVPTRLCIKQKGRRKGGLYRVYFAVFCFIYLFIYLFIYSFVCLLFVYFLSRDGAAGKDQTFGISKLTTTCACLRDQI